MLLLQLISIYVNIAVFTFLVLRYFVLWFICQICSYILGPLKCFMTSGSIKSIETTNSLFSWVFVFLSSKFYLSTYGDIVYNNVKLCNCLQFYSPQITYKDLQQASYTKPVCCLNSLFSQFLNLKQYINNIKSLYRLTLIHTFR